MESHNQSKSAVGAMVSMAVMVLGAGALTLAVILTLSGMTMATFKVVEYAWAVCTGAMIG